MHNHFQLVHSTQGEAKTIVVGEVKERAGGIKYYWGDVKCEREREKNHGRNVVDDDDHEIECDEDFFEGNVGKFQSSLSLFS